MKKNSVNTQTEALYLADNADMTGAHRVAAELRRLHDANQELLKPLLAWEKAYCDKDFSLIMREFDLMVRAATAKATGEQALAAAPQPAQQQGWKLVPIDANDTMIDAFENFIGRDISGFRQAYQAMLNAAPQPAQQEHMEHTSVRSSGPHM